MTKFYPYIAVGLILFIAGFLAAKKYYGSPNTSKSEETQLNHTVTKTIVTKAPNGASVTTTTTESNTVIDNKSCNKTLPPPSLFNVSVLMSQDYTSKEFKPTYGISVSKQVFGPLRLGAFGFTNHVAGLSLGLDF